MLFLFLLLFFSSFASAACNYYLLDVQADFSTLPSNVFPGDIVSLNISVKNNSETCSAQKISAVAVLNEKYFEPLNASDSIDAVSGGEAKPAVFSFKVMAGTPPGSYKFPIKLSYFNFSTVVEETFELVLDVKECFSLDVKNISFSPEIAYAGAQFKIFADVFNSCSAVARDVSVQLVPVTNSSFEPFVVLSSNLVQVGDILPAGSAPVFFTIKPIEDADPKIYVFRLDANCLECSKSFSDTFSFEVLAKPKLIFSGADFSNETRKDAKNIFAGETFSFSVQLDNIGKKTARAVKVVLSTDTQLVGVSESFVGNIDPNDSGTAVFSLTVFPNASVGEHKAKIVVQFLDELGQVQEISEDYSFFIVQPPSNIFGWIVLLALVIIALVVLYFLVKMVFRQLALQKSKLR